MRARVELVDSASLQYDQVVVESAFILLRLVRFPREVSSNLLTGGRRPGWGKTGGLNMQCAYNSTLPPILS